MDLGNLSLLSHNILTMNFINNLFPASVDNFVPECIVFWVTFRYIETVPLNSNKNKPYDFIKTYIFQKHKKQETATESHNTAPQITCIFSVKQ